MKLSQDRINNIKYARDLLRKNGERPSERRIQSLCSHLFGYHPGRNSIRKYAIYKEVKTNIDWNQAREFVENRNNEIEYFSKMDEMGWSRIADFFLGVMTIICLVLFAYSFYIWK